MSNQRFWGPLLAAVMCCISTVWSQPALAAEQAEGGSPAARTTADEPVTLQQDDRIVLLGSTIIEREQRTASWEGRLSVAFRDLNLTFRNLGWSGDTVWAESRGHFDPPAEGYKRMIDQVRHLEPDLILFGYGTNEAFAGPDKLDEFLAQYRRLYEDLNAEGTRFAFLLPLPMEDLGPPWPDPSKYNENVDLYADAITELAQSLDAAVIDLRDRWREYHAGDRRPLTDDQMHLTPHGYAVTGDWLVEDHFVSADGSRPRQSFVPDPVRQAIIEKNRLYFHRWRPQNITYLFGFRSHEQGQNAAEIPRFDPLVEQAEAEIRQLLQQIEDSPDLDLSDDATP